MTLVSVFESGMKILSNLIAIFLVFTNCGPAFCSSEEVRRVHPNVLYQQAWRLLRENYYKQDFNGQDWYRWKDRFSGKLETIDDAYKAIETMTLSLNDSYVLLIRPTDVDSVKEKGTFCGVGMQLGVTKEKKCFVLNPIPSSPAATAGIKAGWEVTKIDGKSIGGLPLAEIAKKIRGPIGTSVKMSFVDNKKTVDLDLKRSEVPVHGIGFSMKLPQDVGYICFDSLIHADAAKQVREKVEEFANTKALILDLRTDAGDLGSFEQMVRIANLFLKDGPIASVVDHDQYVNKKVADGNPIYTKPVVCLINSRTSLMTEALAAALKESGEVELVGERTYGNGKVQDSGKLDDGSLLMFPVGLLLTPGGKSFNSIGIEPTKEVRLSERQKEAGHGPWWKRESLAAGNEIVPNTRDLQFVEALNVLRKKKIIE